MENLSLSRRAFLGAGIATGSLILGFSLPGCSREPGPPAAVFPGGDGALNAFIIVHEDNTLTLQLPFIEMGQGTYTAIPMLIAEELDIGLAQVRPVQADHGPDYKIMFDHSVRFTGGSRSVRSSWEPLRRAGAAARSMLLQAAAGHWQVAIEQLDTEPGVVVEKKTGRRLRYGELAPLAARIKPPQDVTLKEPAQFRLLGQPLDRTDVPQKCNGSAQFGMDFRVDGMLTAAVRQSPVFGGRIRSFDAPAVKGMPGVVAVESIADGVAVIADNYWHAKQAVDKLPVEIEPGSLAGFSSTAYLAKLKSRLDEPGEPVENTGDVKTALGGAKHRIEAVYHVPFLAHATMEPMCSAALLENGKCTLWTPNQGADFAAETAAEITGLPLAAITVHTPFLGGGFGRRFNMDFEAQAVTLANKHPGRPVKVIWSREEDMQHDFYRPMTAAKYRAAFDQTGKPTAIYITNAGDGPGRRHGGEEMKNARMDKSVVDGAFEQPYAIPNRRTDYLFEYAPPPIGYWRSVGNSINAFCKESFIDEMAHAVKRDPVAFRRGLLQDAPRFLKVLDTAAGMAGWRGNPWQAADGSRRAMGVALHKSFGTIVAQVAEVSVGKDGTPRVHRVCAAVDCGFAVNPRIITMQMESAIAYGLSAAVGEEITIEQGRTVNGNFDDYPILTAQQMPDVAVEIINSGEALGGIGETGTPPIAPAVCNALFTLTGKRIRSLPLSAHKLV